MEINKLLENRININYKRKSSEGEDRQVASIEDQDKVLQELAVRYGITINPLDDYEESKSAKKPGRPLFNRMVENIEKSGNSVIYAWHANRLARNGQDAGKMIQLVSDGKVKAIVTPSKIYTDSGTDILMLYLDFGMSDKYSKDLSVDVKRGMNSKLHRHWWPAGSPKPGYINVPAYENGFAEVTQKTDPERFPLLRMAIERYLTGKYSIKNILDFLNEDLGYKTRRSRGCQVNKAVKN